MEERNILQAQKSPFKPASRTALGIPWQSSGQASTLSLQRVQVQSLVGELRSPKLHGQKKKKLHLHQKHRISVLRRIPSSSREWHLDVHDKWHHLSVSSWVTSSSGPEPCPPNSSLRQREVAPWGEDSPFVAHSRVIHMLAVFLICCDGT